MKRVMLGKTGLEVNKLGFGGIPIQRVPEEQAVQTVLHAVEKGIDFIDTARAYTSSEKCIGMALKQTLENVVIATKSQKLDADGMLKDIETSLKNLQLESIDIYQCHNIRNREDFNKVVSSGGALEGLMKAKSQGLIRHIGMSSHSLDLMEYALDRDIFETVMVCFSFLEPKAREQVFQKAVEKGVGIICMKPFSGGVIDDSGLALRYSLSHDEILVIPGVESIELFDENWDVYQGRYDLTDEELEAIEEIRKRFDKVFCRRCDYCQPCTEDIPISLIIGLRSMVGRFGEHLLNEGSPIRAGVKKAKNCSECGECMERCPYDLHIPDLIKDTLEWCDKEFHL